MIGWWLLPIGLAAMGAMYGLSQLFVWWWRKRLFFPSKAETAIRTVWEALGLATSDMPRVGWEEAGERCGKGNRGFLLNGRCVAGYSVWGYSKVSWWPGAKFSETALAHELAHHWFWLTTQNYWTSTEDAAHNHPKFQEAVNVGTAALLEAEREGRL